MIDTLSLSRASLGRVVASAIRSMLNGDVVEVRPEPGEFVFASAIGITGTRNATVVVRANRAATTFFASTMFGLGEADLTDADLADALLELTNVLGGAAKTAVGGENMLALPIAIGVDLTEADVKRAENVICFAVHDRVVSVHVVDGAVVPSAC